MKRGFWCFILCVVGESSRADPSPPPHGAVANETAMSLWSEEEPPEPEAHTLVDALGGIFGSVTQTVVNSAVNAVPYNLLPMATQVAELRIEISDIRKKIFASVRAMELKAGRKTPSIYDKLVDRCINPNNYDWHLRHPRPRKAKRGETLPGVQSGTLDKDDFQILRKAIENLDTKATSKDSKLRGFSERDFFALATTPMGEARGQIGCPPSSKVDDPCIRLNMASVMSSIHARVDSATTTDFDQALKPWAFSVWNREDPNISCMVLGPKMLETKSQKLFGKDEPSHDRALLAFRDFSDPRYVGFKIENYVSHGEYKRALASNDFNDKWIRAMRPIDVFVTLPPPPKNPQATLVKGHVFLYDPKRLKPTNADQGLKPGKKAKKS